MINSFKISLLVIVFQLSGFASNIGPGEAGRLYVENFKNDAIKEMLLYNIPASITLAQGMLESGNGTSDLAVYANNHFGIKCHAEWKGPTFIKNDDTEDECFRKYPTVLDSYTDHSLFLKSRARYSKLFELNNTDYKGWAKGLKEAGYATDPKYVQRLLGLIEAYELFKYDLQQPESRKKNSAKKTSRHAEKKSTINKKSPVKNTSPQHNEIAGKKSGVTVEIHEPREILRFGIVKYIVIKPKDTFYKIARDTDKDLWQLYKFNDLKPGDNLVPGQKLYLQPKRKKADEPFHIVKTGETMKFISQFYGIQLKQLYKKNNMREWEEAVPGQKMYMRERKK